MKLYHGYSTFQNKLSERRRSTPILFGIITTSLAFALASQVHAQQIKATAGQKVEIPNLTYPNPILGISASGVGAEIIGEDAVISFDKNGAAVRALNGGFIDLKGGSITNFVTGTGTLKPVGVEASSSTIFLEDLSVTVSASGAPMYNTPTGLSVVGSGRLEATNVQVSVSGNTVSAEPASAVRINNALGTLILSGASTVHTSGERVNALLAQNGGDITSFDSEITTTGNHSAAVYSNASGVGGSTITLEGGSVTTSGIYSHGLYGARQSGPAAADAGFFATLSATDVVIETSGATSYGVFADRGSHIILNGGSVKTTGAAASAMRVQATTDGIIAPPSVLDATNTTVLATGHASKGVEAVAGGVANLSGGSVTTTAYEGFALHASDAGSPDGTRSTINAEDVTIHTSLRAAHGANAVDGGLIHLKGGSITVMGGNEQGYAPGYTYGLNAQGANSRITSENVAILTHEAWSYGVHAGYEGTVELTGGTVQTTGERAHGLSASGRGGSITSNADVTTSGNLAAGAQAYDALTGNEFNYINLTDGTITTTGDGAAGIKAVGAGSQVDSIARIVTHGTGSTGAVADRNGVIKITGGSVGTSALGSIALGIANGGSITVENASVIAANAAAYASFSGATADLEATYTFGAGSNVLTRNDEFGVLLAVSRADDSAGSTGNVTLNLLTGAVAQGRILDNDLLGARTGFLDIKINQGAQLTSNAIEGFRSLLVDGSLLGNGSLTIGAGVSLDGSGYVAHDVTVQTGGSLSRDLVIRGTVVLDDQYEKNASELTEPTEVENGRQLVVEGEVSTEIDATNGTATLEGLGSGGTLRAGNWGASVGTLNGGVIEASEGSSVVVGQVQGGSVVSGTLVVSNDGTGGASGGELSVGGDATLSGNGLIQAQTTIAGALNPGNSPGALTFASGLTLTSNSTTTLEVNGLGEGDYDQIIVSGGDFLIEGGTLVLSIGSIGNGEYTFDLFDGTPTSESFFSVVQVIQDGITFNLEENIPGFWTFSDLNGLSRSYSFDVGTGIFEYEVVPEPETYALLVGAGAALWMAQRRRRRARA